MITRSSLFLVYRIKIHRPIFQSPHFHQNLVGKSTLTVASRPFSPSYLDYDNFDIVNYKDWLSPTESVKIFQTLKDPNSALSVFNHLSKRRDYKPNEALYTAVISKLAMAKNFDAVEDVMRRIKLEKRCRLSDDFFYLVIRIHGQLAGRLNRAVETLLDMPSYNCWPTVKTFNFLLNLLVSKNQFAAAHDVYTRAPKLGVQIDACCLNIIIKGLCRRGDIDAALYVLDEFPQQGCTPNERTYSTLMRGLCARGRADEALGLLKTMEREGIEPDSITFNILILGFRKQKRGEEGIELFNKMMINGYKPNTGTYQEVLYSFIDTKKFVEAKDVMSKMIKNGAKPSIDSYKMMIRGLCKQRLAGDVDWVLNQMVRQGLVPKMGIWRWVIKCLFSGRKGNDFNDPHEQIISSILFEH